MAQSISRLIAPVVVGIALVTGVSAKQPARTYHPELVIRLHCYSTIDYRKPRLSGFLRSRDFYVREGPFPLNAEWPHALLLLSIGPGSRRVDFQEDAQAELYTINVWGPAPTHHDASLEHDLVAFVESMSCAVRTVSRQANSVDAAGLYKQLLAETENLLALGSPVLPIAGPTHAPPTR
jgi:hypothetical protein